MSFEWLAWSNPVALWWSFLLIVSMANIAFLLLLYSQFRKGTSNPARWIGPPPEKWSDLNYVF
jgi:hypothetical protein